ncbi:MAG: T9SS type A sorting domain-containing protein [Bacteroidia bacterium]
MLSNKSENSMNFSTSNLSSGIYFVIVETGSLPISKKVLVP